MPITAVNFRLVVVCLAAASVGLPIAIISISKLLLLLFALGTLLWLDRRPAPATHLTAIATPTAVFLALGGLALSILWSDAPLPQG